MSAQEARDDPIMLDLKLSVYHSDKGRANYLMDPRFNFHIGIPDREVYETLREVSERWFLCGLPSEETWFVMPISERDASKVDKNSVGVIKPQPHKSAGKDYYSLIFYGLTPRDGITYDTATRIYRCALSSSGNTLSFPNPGKLKRVAPKPSGREVVKPAHFRPFQPYPEPEDIPPRPVFSTHRGYNLVEPTLEVPPQVENKDSVRVYHGGNVVVAASIVIKTPEGRHEVRELNVSTSSNIRLDDRRGWVFWSDKFWKVGG